jgi:hypothetical protein
MFDGQYYNFPKIPYYRFGHYCETYFDLPSTKDKYIEDHSGSMMVFGQAFTNYRCFGFDYLSNMMGLGWRLY